MDDRRYILDLLTRVNLLVDLGNMLEINKPISLK